MSAKPFQAHSVGTPGLGSVIMAYNLAMALALPLVPLFLAYQWLIRGKGRESLLPRLGYSSPGRGGMDGERPLIWIHAVSVGEVMAAVPLIKRLRQVYPSTALWVSTITETGQATAREKLPEADRVFYFPFDLPWTVRKLVRRIRPALFVLLETEIWPNFLFCLVRFRIPSILVNGRLSAASFRGYRLLSPLFRRVLSCISIFSVQTRQDRERFLALGVDADRVVRTGNMKYDQAVGAWKSDSAELKKALRLSDACRLMIAGSTHEGEEETLLQCYLRLAEVHPEVRFMLAPRHLDRLERIESLVRRAGLNPVRKTKLDASGFTELPEDTVVLLDTLGELQGLYAAATLVFVGGSLVPIGGHNVLEPAALARPVLFGPYMDNFHEISRLLLESGGACQVSGAEGLFTEIGGLLSDPERCGEMGRRAREVVLAHRGAVEENLALIRTLLGAGHA